jgi:type I restriction enzyme S subunit
MNAETLLENFDVLVEATDGIDNLRTLLIDFGIRGLLTGSNEFGDNGFPISWKVEKFKDYCDIEGGNQPPKSSFSSEPKHGYIRLFQIRDLGSNPVPVYIPTKSAKSLSATGDILIGRYGASVGKVFYAQDGAYNVALVKFVFPKNELISEFVYWMLRSSRSQAIFSGMSRSAQAGFNKRDLAVLDIPAPSINEQKLIITKINDLMTLCDQLEQLQKQRDNLRIATRKSAIDAISTATTPEELETAWKRINNNWEVIADSLASVDHLKKLILANGASGTFLLKGPRTNFAGLRKTLGELCEIYQPKTISTRELIENGMHLVYGANGVIGRYDKFNHEFEEVLVTCRGATCGTVNVSVPKSWINGNAMVVQPKSNGLSKDYLAMILRGIDYASVITGTAQPQITRQPLSKISIFVPSVAEQKQIVAKVDELMALCDQLEVKLNVRNQVAEKFARSVVNAA